MMIKEWFFDKNFDANERYIVRCADHDFSVERETEKALLCVWVSRYGTLKKWVPKSCMMTREEYDAEMAKNEERIDKAIEDYKNLVQWAKDNGVKGVRNKMKKSTILRKIEEAGLTYSA